jgi:hypothetical protein
VLLGGPDDQHDVRDADDVERAGPAQPVAGDDLDDAVALSEPALLGQPRREPQHPADEGERQDQPDDHPRHRAASPALGARGRPVPTGGIVTSLMR